MDALRAVDIVQAARRAASATGPPVTFEAHSTVIALCLRSHCLPRKPKDRNKTASAPIVVRTLTGF